MTAKLLEAPFRKREIHQSVIDLLEKTLERARDGEIVSCAIACVLDDMTSFTGYSQSDFAQTQIGALRILEHKLVNAVYEPDK